jgi:hypothetical protein
MQGYIIQVHMTTELRGLVKRYSNSNVMTSFQFRLSLLRSEAIF